MSLATSTLSADVDAIHSAEIQTAQVSGIESQTAMSAMPTYPQASGITLRMCSQPECTSILAPAYPKRRCPRCRTHAKEVARHHKRSAERMLHMDSGSSPGPSSAASPSKKLRTASNPYPNLTANGQPKGAYYRSPPIVLSQAQTFKPISIPTPASNPIYHTDTKHKPPGPPSLYVLPPQYQVPSQGTQPQAPSQIRAANARPTALRFTLPRLPPAMKSAGHFNSRGELVHSASPPPSDSSATQSSSNIGANPVKPMNSITIPTLTTPVTPTPSTPTPSDPPSSIRHPKPKHQLRLCMRYGCGAILLPPSHSTSLAADAYCPRCRPAVHPVVSSQGQRHSRTPPHFGPLPPPPPPHLNSPHLTPPPPLTPSSHADTQQQQQDASPHVPPGNANPFEINAGNAQSLIAAIQAVNAMNPSMSAAKKNALKAMGAVNALKAIGAQADTLGAGGVNGVRVGQVVPHSGSASRSASVESGQGGMEAGSVPGLDDSHGGGDAGDIDAGMDMDLEDLELAYPDSPEASTSQLPEPEPVQNDPTHHALAAPPSAQTLLNMGLVSGHRHGSIPGVGISVSSRGKERERHGQGQFIDPRMLMTREPARGAPSRVQQVQISQPQTPPVRLCSMPYCSGTIKPESTAMRCMPCVMKGWKARKPSVMEWTTAPVRRSGIGKGKEREMGRETETEKKEKENENEIQSEKEDKRERKKRKSVTWADGWDGEDHEDGGLVHGDESGPDPEETEDEAEATTVAREAGAPVSQPSASTSIGEDPSEKEDSTIPPPIVDFTTSGDRVTTDAISHEGGRVEDDRRIPRSSSPPPDAFEDPIDSLWDYGGGIDEYPTRSSSETTRLSPSPLDSVSRGPPAVSSDAMDIDGMEAQEVEAALAPAPEPGTALESTTAAPPTTPTPASVATISGWDSDLTDLSDLTDSDDSDSSSDSDEPLSGKRRRSSDETESSSEDEPLSRRSPDLSSTRLVIRLPARPPTVSHSQPPLYTYPNDANATVPGTSQQFPPRICGVTHCKQPLPDPREYRYKCCAPCRKKRREAERRKAGNFSTEHNDLPPPKQVVKQQQPAKHPTFKHPSKEDARAALTNGSSVPGSRLCSIEWCHRVIPPSDEYQWKMCHFCRVRANSRGKRQRQRASGSLDPDPPPDYSLKAQLLQRETDLVMLPDEHLNSIPEMRKRTDGRCVHYDCGMFIDPESPSPRCVHCIGRTKNLHAHNNFNLVKSSSYYRARPKRFIPPEKPRKRSPYPAYQSLSKLLLDFQGKLANFLEAQSYYLLCKASASSSTSAPGTSDPNSTTETDPISQTKKSMFGFDGEYSVIVPDLNLLYRSGEVAVTAIRVKNEIERVGLFSFDPRSRTTAVAYGGVITRFACNHRVSIFLPPGLVNRLGVKVEEGQPQPQSLPAYPKDMIGELEVVVIPDDSHRMYAGQRTVVRFRLVG